MELQQQIGKSRSLDSDVADIIKAFKGKRPTPIQHNLTDWTTKLFEGNEILHRMAPYTYSNKFHLPS
jgi:hypothetical protein